VSKILCWLFGHKDIPKDFLRAKNKEYESQKPAYSHSVKIGDIVINCSTLTVSFFESHVIKIKPCLRCGVYIELKKLTEAEINEAINNMKTEDLLNG
jgi:hypothetical protein